MVEQEEASNFVKNFILRRAADAGVDDYGQLKDGLLNKVARHWFEIDDEDVTDRLKIKKDIATRAKLEEKANNLNLGPFPDDMSTADIRSAITDAENKTPAMKMLTAQLERLTQGDPIAREQIRANQELNLLNAKYQNEARLDSLAMAKSDAELKKYMLEMQNRQTEREWKDMQQRKDLARVDTLVSAIPQIAALFL